MGIFYYLHCALEIVSDSSHLNSHAFKHDSRALFRSCDVPMAPGTPDVDDEDLLSSPKHGLLWSSGHKFLCMPRDLALGIARQIVMNNVKPKRWMVKLNQGFSGKGNASFDIQTVQDKIYLDSSGHPIIDKNALVNSMSNEIETLFPKLKFECEELSWRGDSKHTSFIDQMSRLGAVAEVFVAGSCVRSPSVQAVVDPKLSAEDRIQILSTHEQVLS
eukprot:944794_1